jgi:dihydrofolate synthase/folylpolyglutamate synthase
VPLLGRHQVVNATAAIAAVEELRKRGITIADEHIAEGLRRVEWPGRFEILSREPFVVVDGAHNVDSARQLVVALCDYFPGRRIVLVFGASADKDIVGMLAELLSGARALVATSARNPRAAPPERIIDAVGTWGGEVYTCPDVAAALEQALWLAGSDNVVCITGSLFVVAEARQAWFERQGNPLPASDPL